jgi:predicted ATPase
MVHLKLFVFGPPRLERDGQQLALGVRKVLALLVYLAVTAQPHSRDTLATLLWPESDQSEARARLRRTLHRLSQVLGGGVLEIGPDTICLHPQAPLWLDSAAFQQHVAAGLDPSPGAMLDPERLAHLSTAAALYTDDFLAGFTLPDSPEFDDWQFFERERVRQTFAQVLVHLVQAYQAQQAWEEAIGYARRWVGLDVLHEPAQRALIQLYALAGQQAAALRQYQECVRVLEAELGVEPEAETTALYDAIRTRQFAPPAAMKRTLSPAQPALEPRPHERYVQEELLAVGGHGEIYRGRDRLTGQPVAIKWLKPELIVQHPELITRFVREGEVLRQLNHPNIVNVRASFKQDGQYAIVMDYVAGGSLRALLDQTPQLPLQRVLDIGLELADALSRTHHLGILHRDLKPENVLLADDGTPRLTDFGLARLQHDDARLTHTGELVGSPAYMSPEALRGEELDARSDIWSFGVLLYEMLAGRRPFEGTRITPVLVSILEGVMPEIRQFRPNVPPALVNLLHSLLARQREQRIASMRQVAAGLEAIRAGQPIEGLASTTMASTSVSPAAPASPTPTEAATPVFVARQPELARLDAWLDAALAGAGRVAFVIGEAGRGKTALLQAFAQRAQQAHPDLVVTGGNCNAYTGMGDPYLPFREILELLTGDVEARSVAGTLRRDHASRLWHTLPGAAQALAEVGPDLLDTFIAAHALLGRAAAYAPEGAAWLTQLREVAADKAARPAASVQQQDLFEQYARVMQALARRAPLLLVLDDLQWADLGSTNLLFHLGRQLAGCRVLIVGAYRPAEVALGRDGERHPLERVVNEFRRDFGEIVLDLSQAEGRALMDALLDSEPNRLDEAFRATLYRQTGGHPLFTIELLRGMQERGDLARDEAGCWVAQPRLDWTTLPARVEGAIGERISRLDPSLRELLQVASVVGEEFMAELVARVLNIDEREVVRRFSRDLDQTHRLVRALGIKREGALRLSQYRFRHILIQRYLYHSLDGVERAYLNEAVGDALERLYSAQTEQAAVQLARYFQEAGILDKAAGYLLQAGTRARRLSANEEAIAHYSQALTLLETLPDTPERSQLELDVHIALGPALMLIKGHSAPEVEKTYARAYELCQQVEEPSKLFPALWGLWRFNLNRGTLRTAHELGAQCLALAQTERDPELLVEAHIALGTTLVYLGEFIDANKHFEQGKALYNPQQHRLLPFLYGGFDPEVYCLSYEPPYFLWMLGYPDQALQRSREALNRARELSHPYSLAFALVHAAIFHQCRRDGQTTQHLAEEAVALCSEHGFSTFLGMSTALRGWALVEQGQGEGITQLYQGLAIYQAAQTGVLVPYCLALLAEVHLKLGQIDEGLTTLNEAMALVENTDGRLWEAQLYRLKGELLLKKQVGSKQQDDALSPADCFVRAMEIARQQAARILELRATMSLCRLWQHQGNVVEARQMLAEIYGWFTEGFDTVDLIEARALLEELGNAEVQGRGNGGTDALVQRSPADFDLTRECD